MRKLLSDSLASFIQILQPVPQFAEKLEVFRTETLAQMDPIDKKSSAAANAAMDELLDSTVGSENFVIPEIAISTTRTGLFVYLSASVSNGTTRGSAYKFADSDVAHRSTHLRRPYPILVS